MSEPVLRLVLGDQLFGPGGLPHDVRGMPVFMAEDWGLCRRVPHHKQKIVLFLAAMRSYADDLRAKGVEVVYRPLLEGEDGGEEDSYEKALSRVLDERGVTTLVRHEIEDKFFEKRIDALAEARGMTVRVLSSPMFVTGREAFAEDLAVANGRAFMASFYQRQRKRLGVLMDASGEPVGGKWSFDAENRKKLPKGVAVPGVRWAEPTGHVRDLIALVNDRFADHPGDLSEGGWWLPTTRRQALAWLKAFLEERFAEFGDYEDALSGRDVFLFHSVLSPVMNVGLLTPGEIIKRALTYAETYGTPMNSVEGFVRQVIGWREFVRGVYRHFSEEQEQANYFGHHRRMTGHWWRGETGVLPLDDAVKKAIRYGWCHHIERLMVMGNLMTLCEIEPRQAHDFFMSMFVDSADWVMGPNVYGMGLFSDGGVFATKPYVCGSHYLRKMSDYGKAEDGGWCDVVDGLYWRFIGKHREKFAANPRMSMMVRAEAKLSDERRARLMSSAEGFLERVTR